MDTETIVKSCELLLAYQMRDLGTLRSRNKRSKRHKFSSSMPNPLSDVNSCPSKVDIQSTSMTKKPEVLNLNLLPPFGAGGDAGGFIAADFKVKDDAIGVNDESPKEIEDPERFEPVKMRKKSSIVSPSPLSPILEDSNKNLPEIVVTKPVHAVASSEVSGVGLKPVIAPVVGGPPAAPSHALSPVSIQPPAPPSHQPLPVVARVTGGPPAPVVGGPMLPPLPPVTGGPPAPVVGGPMLPPLPPVTGGPPVPSSARSCGGPPPPPPPPPSLKGFVVMRKKTSIKAVEHDKKLQTSVCRWESIDDAKAKGTLFENVTLALLSKDLQHVIASSFPKKESSTENRSARSSTVEFGTMPHQKKLALNIVLAKNKMSPEEFCRRITQDPDPQLNLEILDGILKNFPSDDELGGYQIVESVDHFSNVVDVFCWHLSRSTGIKFLIEVNLHRSEVSLDVKRYTSSMEVLQGALKNVISSYPHISMLLHTLLKIGNYLNQGSPNFGAAGFSFHDVHRLLSTRSENDAKESIIEMMLHSAGGKFTLSMHALLDLKPAVNEASKHNLDEVQKMLAVAQDKAKTLTQQMRAASFVTDEFKAKVVEELERIEEDVRNLQANVEIILQEIEGIFTAMVVPKTKKSEEFFAYFETVLVLIAGALEKQRRKKELAEKSALKRDQGGRYSLRIGSLQNLNNIGGREFDSNLNSPLLENIELRRSIQRRKSKKDTESERELKKESRPPIYDELRQRLQRFRKPTHILEEVNNNIDL